MNTASTSRHERERTRETLIIASFLGDLAVVLAALFGAYWLRFDSPVVNYGVVHLDMTLGEYMPHIALGATLMMVFLGNFRLYAPAYLHAVRRHWRIVGQACALWILAYVTISLVLKVNPPISRVYCVIAGCSMLLGLLAWRKFFNVWISRDTVSTRITQKVLFIGWSDESARLIESIRQEPSHVYQVVGVVPDAHWIEGQEPPADVPRLGGYDQLEEILRGHEIDLVLLTDMGLAREQLVNIALVCEKEMVEFKLIPNVFQVLISGLHLENLGGIPLLGVSRLPLHSTVNYYLKRAVDILGGLVGLALTAPVMAAFGAMIKLEDGGPIFYRQQRLGRNGKPFFIYKLRSMRIDAEQRGVGWTVKNDPRCLRVGAFMRKWNIDEVPQFWNVIKGDMSLVGPRPERPELIENFKHQILHYNARHNIKPGITGWAQVNGLRGDTDLTERIKADLYYIENWNLWLDFQIMAMTFFKREGAC